MRNDPDSQGQWDFTISEAEEYVLYRVRAKHVTVETNKNAPMQTGILSYGETQIFKSALSVDIDNSNLGTENDVWTYNKDKTLRTNVDRTTIEYRVITTDANGNYTTAWRSTENAPDESVWVV